MEVTIMLVFIIGCILFTFALGMGIYWMIFHPYRHNLILTPYSFYIMTILHILYFFFGSDILEEETYALLSISVSLILIMFNIFYIFTYLTRTYDNRLIKIITLVPNIIIEILIFIFTNKSRISINYLELIILFATIFIFIITQTNNKTVRNIDQDYDYYFMHYDNSDTDIPHYSHYKYLFADSDLYNDLSDVIFKLYHLQRKRPISLSIYRDYLENETSLPINLKKRIINRLQESYRLLEIEKLSIIDFAVVILPEFYSPSTKTISSEKYERRLFEEYYYLLRKNISNSNQQFEKICEKLETLINADTIKNISENPESHECINTSETSTDNYVQSIVREINHCIKGPLLAIKYAAKNLLMNTDNLTDIQKEKLETIEGNEVIIEAIIGGYRKLVFLAEDNIPSKIDNNLTTFVKGLNQQSGKNIAINIKEFVDPNITYGNSIITIMLLPLVHNAYEASPKNETIHISCSEKSTQYIIRIENVCENKVSGKDLVTDGFTTKEKGGEGLRSVRRISESLGFEFSIKTYDNGQKVVALLKIPNSKEEVQ